jgi:hypothetical protein
MLLRDRCRLLDPEERGSVSEYQYYEFVALDRPLTPAEMAELRGISTRAEITPTRFVNEYQWGDLKADPAELLARYFDVHLYFANWGSQRLMFRLPLDAVDLDELRACMPGSPAGVMERGEHVVVDLWSETEEPEDDFDDADQLAALTPLRAQLLQGDRRLAYVAWLLAVQAGEVAEDMVEPPVPAGLDAGSGSLMALTRFLRVDPYLLAAAAEAAGEDAGELERFKAWVGDLPASEQRRWLLRAAGDVDLALGGVLLREFRRAHPPHDGEQRRSTAELLSRAGELRAQRRRESIKQGLRPGWPSGAGSRAERARSSPT